MISQLNDFPPQHREWGLVFLVLSWRCLQRCPLSTRDPSSQYRLGWEGWAQGHHHKLGFLMCKESRKKREIQGGLWKEKKVQKGIKRGIKTKKASKKDSKAQKCSQVTQPVPRKKKFSSIYRSKTIHQLTRWNLQHLASNKKLPGTQRSRDVWHTQKEEKTNQLTLTQK